MTATSCSQDDHDIAIASPATLSIETTKPEPDPDCAKCGWNRFGCSHELSGCRRSTVHL